MMDGNARLAIIALILVEAFPPSAPPPKLTQAGNVPYQPTPYTWITEPVEEPAATVPPSIVEHRERMYLFSYKARP
jgi:hypothetical protein